MERTYADLLSQGVREAQLYFCLQEDITLTLQAAAEAASVSSRSPTRLAATSGHGCGELRFLWNAHIAAPLWAAGTSRFTLPLVCGFVGSVSIDGGRAAGLEVRSAQESISLPVSSHRQQQQH